MTFFRMFISAVMAFAFPFFAFGQSQGEVPATNVAGAAPLARTAPADFPEMKCDARGICTTDLVPFVCSEQYRCLSDAELRAMLGKTIVIPRVNPEHGNLTVKFISGKVAQGIVKYSSANGEWIVQSEGKILITFGNDSKARWDHLPLQLFRHEGQLYHVSATPLPNTRTFIKVTLQ